MYGELIIQLELIGVIFFGDICLKVWVTIDLLRYCSQICTEICDHLNVELFRIPYPGRLIPATVLTAEKNGTNNKSLKTRSRKYYQ